MCVKEIALQSAHKWEVQTQLAAVSSYFHQKKSKNIFCKAETLLGSDAKYCIRKSRDWLLRNRVGERLLTMEKRGVKVMKVKCHT